MFRITVLFFLIISSIPVLAQQRPTLKFSAYLFTYFTGNDKKDEAIRYAISTDGYRFRTLNDNKPVINSEKISETGGIRDPHIIRGADGKTFYMVATDMVSALGWSSNRAMVLMKSTDLINWTSSIVNIQKKYRNQDSLLRVWAPQTIYDPTVSKYMVYFSLKHGKDPDKIYYAYANKDFTDLEGEPKQLFFSPDKAACIDGDIVEKAGKYYLFFKTEDRKPGIKVAVSDQLTAGYEMLSRDYVQRTTDPVEGAGTFKLNDGSGFILMYDLYTKGKYQFTKTNDFRNFEVVDEDVSMNFHPRHGTVMPITFEEAARLTTKWLPIEDVILTPGNKAIRKNNIVYDTAASAVQFSVLPGTNLKLFNPGFSIFPGAQLTPANPQDFRTNAVTYSVMLGDRKKDIKVSVAERHNPVLAGYYADPDVLYSEKTRQFYIYPTSDGFNNWLGSYFKTFSSADLVTWKDEGVILDLVKDVSWAKRNAWAPCIVEKKIDGKYKYFYYFTAAQKIGVAVSDNPTGPFVDAGKALIEKFPDGITRGQQIDPDVFTDPKTGKSYLYWGNSYMAGAELNADMISLKEGTTTLLNQPKSFREGTYVFYREGKYYFMWSEDDTRSPNYRVAYAIADGPLGKLIIPDNNLVLSKDAAAGIYGPGHNSVLQIPGKDEWYMVYHRFNYPNGINMGSAAGYNREVCIDKMEFNADGTIKPVKPTHEGISPVMSASKN